MEKEELPRPCGWRLIVQPREVEEKTKSGIFLPDQAKDAEAYNTADGIVLAVGPLCWKDPKYKEHPDQKTPDPWCEVGDHVTYGKFAGQKRVVNGKTILILNEDEITSVLPPTA